VINIAVRSEYSFNAFAPIKQISELPGSAIGIADDNSTFGHYQLYKLCNERGVKPILGVRLMVTLWKVEKRKGWGPNYIFIAKNNDGLVEIYELVKKSFDNFYYFPFIELKDVVELSENVIVISEHFETDERIDYIGISPITTPKALKSNLPKVALSSNRYIHPHNRHVYELLAGDKRETQTYPQYILSSDHHKSMFGNDEAIKNTYVIAEQCNVEFTPSDMIRYKGSNKIEYLCKLGSIRLKVNLEDPEYKARYEREMKLIIEKDYVDYFLIVADMIKFAKKSMLVGPSRGSSAGSLVCYLCGITTVDPIKYGLLFERFIDINREDLPDIDVDFPDVKRDRVIKHLSKTYGKDKVAHIATVARLKPKSAIGIFAKNLSVPISATEEVKGAIIERSGGDARAAMCIMDTFETTEIGREFIDHYPKMRLVEQVENHASHTGTHAAGIIVCNYPLTKYGSINSRDNVVMLDKYEADGLNLLKIDCLGLRTLSILEEIADRIGMPYKDYYSLPLDDAKVFKTFNDMRLFGIFQFEGYALQSVTREMGVNSFDDIAAITALARPGPIHSGGTNLYVRRRTGREPVEYLSDHVAVVEATRDTLGIIIYQEQLMEIARKYGGMSWEDVSELRKAASKSLGEEYFNRYKEKFFEGTREKGIDDVESENVWLNMMTFGSWGFNKSHAVSYGMVSYWTAWAKTYHPLEFAAASMNNARSDDASIKILRDLVRHDGIEYKDIDPDYSIEKWDIGTNDEGNRYLVGGLTTIKGIGVKKAADIVQRRANRNLTANQLDKLINAKTPFSILFPAQHYWGKIYDNPAKYGLDRSIEYVENIKEEGEYLFIGRLVDRNLRDLNEYQSVVKRGGKIIENDTLFLNMTVEDDTGSIICTIDRFKFERIGRKIAEQGKVDHDWYLIAGEIKGQWRRINIKTILNLWEWNSED
jgi:DNA-directed DNA polymerase III PolC